MGSGMVVFALAFFALLVLSLATLFKTSVLGEKIQRLERELGRLKRELAGLQKEISTPRDEGTGEEMEERPQEASPLPPSGEVPAGKPGAEKEQAKEEGEKNAGGKAEEGPGELPSLLPLEEGRPAPPSPTESSGGRTAEKPALRRRAPFSLEEALGPRLALWVGAVALAFAAAFLVHYSWKMGWFTPTLRVLSGLVMGIVLLGLGVRLKKRTERIAAALTAAGVADIYICLWAAASVWNLIPAWLGFAFLAAATAGAILLSLHQGQIVLALGLLGGYAAPLLVPSIHPRPEVLFPYLFLLCLGILAVTLHRKWILPAAASFAFQATWAAYWIQARFLPPDSPWVGSFLLLSTLAFLLPSTSGKDTPAWGSPFGPYLGRGAALGGGIFLLGILWVRSGFAPAVWILLLILCGQALLLASRGGIPESWIAWGAMLVQAGALLLWEEWRHGPGPGRLVLYAGGTGLFFAACSYLLLWRSPRPMALSALVSAAALSYFMVLYVHFHGEGYFHHWWEAEAGLGLLLAAAAFPLYKKRKVLPQGDYALAGLAWGAVAGFCAALPMATSGIYITLGWALAVPILAHLDLGLEIPSFRYASAILGVFTGVRLLANRFVLLYPLEKGSFFNWIFFGYGLSALFFLETRRVLGKRGAPGLSRSFLAGAVLFLFYLVTLQVRHFFHPLGLAYGGFLMSEWASYSSAWLFLGLLLLLWHRLRPDPVLERGGKAAAVLGLLAAALAQGIFFNPLWTGDPVGRLPILDLLLFLYGVPWILCLLLARVLPSLPGKASLATAFRAGALVFSFLLLNLEVRHWFHGPFLGGPSTGGGENYAYSAAWALYGLLLLGLGIRRGSPFLRVASLGAMALTVFKVFLFDTSRLGGLYRVFSFLCLGVSLFLLAWLYQKFVFREEGFFGKKKGEARAG